MKITKYALFFLLVSGSAYAQAPSTAQWGINKTSSPYPVSINVNNSWAQMGTVSSGGVWSLPVGNITNSSVPLLAAVNTWSNLNTVATSGPTWGSYSGIWNQFTSNVNSYPISQSFGNNLVPIASAITGYMRIPSTDTAGNASMGVAGYAVTSAAAPSGAGALGVFGFGGIAVNGASAWGMNAVVTNGISPQPSDNAGYTNAVLYGAEYNFNIKNTSAGATPNVALRGLYFIGDSQSGTSSIATVIDIDGLKFSTPKIPWKIGFNTVDGAVTNAINLGSLSENTGSTSSGSQPITFNSYLSGVAKASKISTDPYGNIVLFPVVGAASAMQVGNSGPTTIFQNTAASCLLTPTTSTPTYSCSSDRRLKENITDSKNALEYIESFRVRDYLVKSTKTMTTGVIAQEVQENHPNMVHKLPDGFLSVDSINAWKLVKAIQELKAKNDELASEIAVIKKKHQ